jgi:HK97 gp10 family phage protein
MEDFNHWEQVFQEIDEKVNKLVRATAFKVEAGAKRGAPVDTGFLRNSIYVRTEDSSDARGQGGELFPELPAAEHNAAYIAVGATYGIYLEYGTSRHAAHPYLTPAVEQIRQPFLDALDKIANGEGVK